MGKLTHGLDRYFHVSKHGSSVGTEMMAGLTTFVTIAYILILNPQILADPFVILGQPELAARIENGVFIGTCLGAFLGTLLCAVYAKVPFAQAPGMGLNAFFAYTVVLGMDYTYGQALCIVFISGALFILITVVGLREAIIRAIPGAVKHAITPGIGLFITIIGLKNAGIIVSNPSTLVAMVDFTQWQNPGADKAAVMAPLVALFGLMVMGVLCAKQVNGYVLIGILSATVLGIPLGVTQLSEFSFSIGDKLKDFAEVSFMAMDFPGLFRGKDPFSALLTVGMLVISFSLVNMFDSIGTLLGAARQGGLVDENGEVLHMKQALMSDAVSTLAGAMVGTSTVTTVVESSSGIAAGGRTGLTSLTTAVLFLGAIFLAPVAAVVPLAAAAPALIFVGILMLSNIRDVDLNDMTNALPGFCTIVFMPFTYSIANGVAMGLITYCLIKTCTGKSREIKPLTWVVALIFVLRYAFMSM